jgi:hypothetical protein
VSDILDAGVQFIELGLLRARIKALEDKLNDKK